VKERAFHLLPLRGRIEEGVPASSLFRERLKAADLQTTSTRFEVR
jgi:hypothetical protein